MGLSGGEEAEGYAKTVVEADFEAPGDADVINKMRTDLDNRGVAVTKRQFRAELDRAAAEARRQIAQP